jgi:homoserine O-acetyltransferase
LVIGISTDVLYPVAEARSMAAAMPNAEFAVLDSPNGHDGFLIDTDRLEGIVTRFLDESRPVASISGHGLTGGQVDRWTGTVGRKP